MNRLTVCLSLILFSIIFIGCTNNVQWEETPENDSIPEFFLTNNKGDTLPTGEKIEAIKPAFHMTWLGRSFKPEYPGFTNIWTETHIKGNNTLEVETLKESPFNLDSMHAEWIKGSPSDTLEHIEPIYTKGKKSLLKNVERVRLDPPDFKETAVADIQFLSSDQGLLSALVTDILFDSRGLTWISTDRGIIRYDGVYAMNYTVSEGLPSNEIYCLEEGPNGDIWMGFANGGFAKYDGSHITIFDKESCGFSVTVTDMVFDNTGTLNFTTFGAGLCTYDGEKIEFFDKGCGVVSHRYANCINQDKDGNIWFCSFGGGMYKKTGDQIRGYHNKAGLRTGWIPSAFIDSKNRIWVGGMGNDFQKIEEGNVTLYQPKIDLPAFVNCFGEDPAGNIWLGTSHNGVFLFEDGVIKQFGTTQGLSSNEVYTIEFDEFGRAWVGTADGGISIINLKSFSYLRENTGFPSNRIYGIDEHKGKTYYATDQGLVVQSGDSLTWFVGMGGDKSTSNLRAHKLSDVLVTDEGVVFASMENFGFGRYTPDMKYLRGIGGNTGSTQNASGLAMNSEGIVYGSSAEVKRLYFFTDTAGYNWDFEHNYVFRRTSDVEIDENDNVWVGSTTRGVCKFDGDHWTYYSTNEGLYSNSVRDLFIDNQNRVWIITDRGLNYIEDDNLLKVDFGHEDYGMRIQSIIQDNKGGYWLGLFNGIIYLKEIKRSETWSLDNYEIVQYSKNDGIINTSCIEDAMYISEDNRLHIGTEGGVLIKETSEENDRSFSPMASLFTIKINSKELDFNRAKDKNYLEEIGFNIDFGLNSAAPFHNYPESLELPFEYNHLTFIYEGTYQGPETRQRLVFEYYIEGIDEGWILGPKDQSADYRNIPYGDYTFHLRSYIDPENPSEEFTYDFTILPPWYHTWWARFFFMVAFISLIWIVLKIRTKALLARQKELENTVEERTAELKEKHEQLEESHQEIKDSIAYAKRIQSAILPPQKLVKEYLPKSFVLYKPKDVVAGDFYWMAHTKDKILFAAADCTGHGVPGAMVSVICNGGLNRSVNEFNLTKPGEILDKTRELVIKEFEKSEEDVKDGMDIALCGLDLNSEGGKTYLEYAGANNALWIIRNGSEEIEEIKANKQPIGKFQDPEPFTTHKIELNEGDSFYIFSDGYADQFGGERGKKFKSANFKKLLLSIQDKNLEDQRRIIDDKFEEWKSHFEQVDDVCVIGVRI